MRSLRRVLIILGVVGVLSLLSVGLAFGLDDDRDGSTSSPIGGGSEGVDYGALHRIRLEIAQRLGIDPRDVRLISLTDAGWDGCLGVIDEDQICTEQFIAGLIAVFEASGEQVRYHIGGGRFVGPVDPARADDGLPIPPEMQTEHLSYLADYARQELALRLGVDVADLTIAYIIPTEFGDTCLGYAPDNVRCGQFIKAEPGAIVGIDVKGKGTEVYSVTRGGVVWHDQANGQTTIAMDEKVVDAQRQLREDLAERLGVDVSEVSIVSFRFVTWPDGCLGVIRPAALCMAALTDGYLAFLGGPDGKVYGYHGGADTFIAVDFEEGISGLQDPVVAGNPQDEIIADLAGRLGVDAGAISVVSFEAVTWADGCLGVIRPAATCLAEPTPGFLAYLAGPDGKGYRYHGGAGAFIAVDFEEGVTEVQDPLE